MMMDTGRNGPPGRNVRDRVNLKPMEHVAADILRMNVRDDGPDGEPRAPVVVVWLDIATGRLHKTTFHLEKGETIGRRHVREAFTRLCTDPDYGVPEVIHIDHGAEWDSGRFVEGLARPEPRVVVKKVSACASAEKTRA